MLWYLYCYLIHALGYPRELRFWPETHNKRQATQHSCLPSLLGDVDKGIEKVYGEETSILYCMDRLEHTKAETKISCTNTTSPTNQPRKDPIHLYSLNPIHLSFISRLGPPLYIVSLGLTLEKISSLFPFSELYSPCRDPITLNI